MQITVVTPSYNQGHYLAETIESVLSQEGDFHLDYIVVDGASRDNSVQVIERYQRLLDGGEWPVKCRGIRYRWLSEKDQGQTDAIMKGFAMGDGEVFAWLNSDDLYLPGALERCRETFSREPETGVVYGRTHFTDTDGKVIGEYPTEPFDYRRLALFNFVCQPATFFRREVVEKAGWLDRRLHYVMDYDLWLRLARLTTFSYLPELLATYRLHDESKTMAAADKLANHREALETVRKYYGWAPLTRVFVHSQELATARLPGSLARCRVLCVACAMPVALLRYLSLNRGVRLEDLRSFTPANLRKIFLDWIDIYKEYGEQGSGGRGQGKPEERPGSHKG